MRSISEILKEEREKKGLSIDDVVATTKIRRDFIVAIERGNFKSLPSDAYAMGFVKNYAQFLGIPEIRAAALMRREYAARHEDIMPTYKKKHGLPGRRFILRSPKGLFIVSLFFIIVVYVIFQFSFLFVGPKLMLSLPKPGAVVSSHIVTVRGKTDPYATVLVNDESVYVDLSGSFSKTLYLYTGDKKITVVAKNRTGKATTKEIPVTVE